MIDTTTEDYKLATGCMHALARITRTRLNFGAHKDVVVTDLLNMQDERETMTTLRTKVAILIVLLAEASEPSVAFNN